MTRYLCVGLVALMMASLPVRAPAHHSYAEYDQQRTIEIEGTLKKVAWQNPHVHFVVLVPQNGAAPATWQIESSGINNLNRMGAKVEHFKVGDKVKVAGWPSKRDASRMYVTNVMSQDGHELVMWRFSKPRWTQSAGGYGTGADRTLFATGVANDSTSLFRVWASDYDDPDAAPEALFRVMRQGNPPLTAAATQARVAADPMKAQGFVGCAPKGMPSMMAQPFPMELIDKGSVIEVRIEEYDGLRTIHMSPASAPTTHTPEGHSTGRWEGKTLVVTTSHLTARPFDATGFQRSTSASLVERFTLNGEGSRLLYSVTVTDPAVFTRPMEFKRSWVWRPGEKVMPFNCTP